MAAQLLDEPRLADPRLADEVDQPSLPGARVVQRRVEHGQLGLAADQRGRVRSASRAPASSPTLDASTGWDLPFTMNGASGSVSKTVASGRARPGSPAAGPGAALPMTRAARLMASPLTEYVRRKGGPKSPAKTGPRFTPMRSGSSPIRSTIQPRRAQHAVLLVAEAATGARR